MVGRSASSLSNAKMDTLNDLFSGKFIPSSITYNPEIQKQRNKSENTKLEPAIHSFVLRMAANELCSVPELIDDLKPKEQKVDIRNKRKYFKSFIDLSSKKPDEIKQKLIDSAFDTKGNPITSKATIKNNLMKLLTDTAKEFQLIVNRLKRNEPKVRRYREYVNQLLDTSENGIYPQLINALNKINMKLAQD
ncbi:MAG: hypothetical protein MK033_09835 [Candidatus Caenarcaniphilales bacterium]|nr:hypothetical protein [Candidatus Caenarcaniphilales bacterium]